MKLNLVAASAIIAAAAAQDCKCLPGDTCWPSTSTWDKLNSTVSGKLVATTPIGSPCHDPTFDAQKCEDLKAQWTNPLTQYVLITKSRIRQT
jgi:hypothetical protein